MAIESLSILLLDGTGHDLLRERYMGVLDNVHKTMISDALKNRMLSGDPAAGSVTAKRFANAQGANYGTAKAAGAAGNIKVEPVNVPLLERREFLEQVELMDVHTYGVDDLINRRIANHALGVRRELERAFFDKAALAASAFTPTATETADQLEELIVTLETVNNDFVDGVPRDMITVIMSPQKYSDVRRFINTDVNNANVSSDRELFDRLNGVRVVSSVYLPSGVGMLAMADESVAQPVVERVSKPRELENLDAVGFGVFLMYGTKAVTPDLIYKIAS